MISVHNVPGAFSSGDPKGEDFRIVLEEILRIHLGEAEMPGYFPHSWLDVGSLGFDFSMGLGYPISFAWRCLDAQYWGVAQRRKRIFLAVDFAGYTAPLLMFDILNEFQALEKSKVEEDDSI